MAEQKLYNVTVRIVQLRWAENEEDAIAQVRRHVDRAMWRTSTLPDGASAFVSEPVPEMGWHGDDDREETP